MCLAADSFTRLCARRFKPSRWLDGAATNMQRYIFFGFGEGLGCAEVSYVCVYVYIHVCKYIGAIGIVSCRKRDVQ